MHPAILNFAKKFWGCGKKNTNLASYRHQSDIFKALYNFIIDTSALEIIFRKLANLSFMGVEFQCKLHVAENSAFCPPCVG